MSNEEILVVVSKLKAHVKNKHQLSTSGNVPGALSKIISHLCAEAAVNAKNSKRKTLMDRDFEGCETGSSDEVLVVVSKLKNHVKSNHELSTSSTVPTAISSIVAKLCSKAAENAVNAKRKTLMDRDFVCEGETASSCEA